MGKREKERKEKKEREGIKETSKGRKKRERGRSTKKLISFLSLSSFLSCVGAFSVVKLATSKKDGSKWAVKIIDKKR